MKIFKLPDLGEGLPEADIREWYVQEGDAVKRDQPMLSVETAKALVDVPAPYDGIVEKLFFSTGDTVKTGASLIGFEGEADQQSSKKEAATVVGTIATSDTVITAAPSQMTPSSSKKVSPSVRCLIRRNGLLIDDIPSSTDRITKQEVIDYLATFQVDTTFTPLPAVRQAMVLSMSASQQEVVMTTVCDDANLSAWDKHQNLTLRTIRAIQFACTVEPIMNSHLRTKTLQYKSFEDIHLGVAIDTSHGLYVPVVKNINDKTDNDIRHQIEQFKAQAQSKTIQQSDLKGATITLSNFGALAGRYATPIVVPPMVAIVGAGRARDEAVVVNGEIKIQKRLPLSISIDHRLITGGEAARFLHAMMDHLSQAEPGSL